MTLRRIGLLLALSGIAFTQSAVRPSYTLDPDTDADAKGAMEWRLMTLRGPDGRVAPDGLSRVLLRLQGVHRRHRYWRRRWRHLFDSLRLQRIPPMAARQSVSSLK